MEEMSITRIRRLLLSFERSVNKNQDQRSKYPNDPSKSVLLLVLLPTYLTAVMIKVH